MTNQFKARVTEQVDDIALAPRIKVVQANHIVAFVDETMAKV
jgi:hypothetical protein